MQQTLSLQSLHIQPITDDTRSNTALALKDYEEWALFAGDTATLIFFCMVSYHKRPGLNQVDGWYLSKVIVFCYLKSSYSRHENIILLPNKRKETQVSFVSQCSCLKNISATCIHILQLNSTEPLSPDKLPQALVVYSKGLLELSPRLLQMSQ